MEYQADTDAEPLYRTKVTSVCIGIPYEGNIGMLTRTLCSPIQKSILLSSQIQFYNIIKSSKIFTGSNRNTIFLTGCMNYCQTLLRQDAKIFDITKSEFVMPENRIYDIYEKDTTKSNLWFQIWCYSKIAIGTKWGVNNKNIVHSKSRLP